MLELGTRIKQASHCWTSDRAWNAAEDGENKRVKQRKEKGGVKKACCGLLIRQRAPLTIFFQAASRPCLLEFYTIKKKKKKAKANALFSALTALISS